MTERTSKRPKVAIVIPAYNEGATIGNICSVAAKCDLADEVIVVSDGSKDSTVSIASKIAGVRVIDLSRNMGKGGAMAEGVRQTDANIIAFVDADLIGLKPEHLNQIIRPLLDSNCDMCIGVFRGGKFWSDSAQRVAPYISGQRALRRELFESIPYLSEMRMGIEVAINTNAKRRKAKILRVVLHGVSNTHKEIKMGLMKGAAARAKMWAEIGRAMVRLRRRKSRKKLTKKLK